MAEVVEILTEALLQIVGIVVAGLISLVALKVKDFLKTEENATQLKQKESYAKLAVEAVELIFKEFEGEEKLRQAKEKLLHWAEENNIPISDEEITVLVESAVKKLKDEGKEIKSVYEEEQKRGE